MKNLHSKTSEELRRKKVKQASLVGQLINYEGKRPDWRSYEF